MAKQLLTTVYEIKKVMDGPKMSDLKGKKVKYYKVRWQDTWEPEANLPKREIELFRSKRKRRAKILGPVANEESTENLHEMQFAVEYDNHIHIYPYKKIKTDYKDELIAYFERCARPAGAPGSNVDDNTSTHSGST